MNQLLASPAHHVDPILLSMKLLPTQSCCVLRSNLVLLCVWPCVATAKSHHSRKQASHQLEMLSHCWIEPGGLESAAMQRSTLKYTNRGVVISLFNVLHLTLSCHASTADITKLAGEAGCSLQLQVLPAELHARTRASVSTSAQRLNGKIAPFGVKLVYAIQACIYVD